MNFFFWEMAALGAAFCWAIASALYDQVNLNLSPILLNLINVLIGLLCVSVLALFINDEQSSLSSDAILKLNLSGLLSLGLGDTAFFLALERLGSRKTLLLGLLVPLFTLFLSVRFLGESLSLLELVGCAFLILELTWVITEKQVDTSQHEKMAGGVAYSLAFALCHASGSILSRSVALDNPSMNSFVGALDSSLFRLLGGAFFIVLLAGFRISRFQFKQQVRYLIHPRILFFIICAAISGTALGFYLMQLALMHIPAALAQILIATSPVFILPLSALAGEKLSFQAILGAILTTATTAWIIYLHYL